MTRSLQRRQVYEHNGGEVDEKYLLDCGDTTVRLKQTIRETQASVHEFANLVLRMAKTLYYSFHDIYEPNIKRYEETKRVAASQHQNERRSPAAVNTPSPIRSVDNSGDHVQPFPSSFRSKDAPPRGK